MGCLISCCCGGEDGEEGGAGERTRLLSECNSQTQLPAGIHDDYYHCNPSSVSSQQPRQNDESSKLNRILTEFAEEIIDISVVEHCEALEQSEVAERLAHYQHKLSLHGGRLAGQQQQNPVLRDLQEASQQEVELVDRVAARALELLADTTQLAGSSEDIVVSLGEQEQ